MARTRGEPPRRHAGPLPMECDYGKKLNGRRPADSPRLPSYNEPETSATERQRGGKHAYTQEKPARNAPETRVCRAMNAMESLSWPRHAALARGKVDSPCSPSMLMSWWPPARAPAPADRTPWARARGASRPDALGAGAGAWESGDPGADACRSDDPGAGAARPDASPNAAAGAGARTKRCRIRKARARGCDRAPSPRSRGS